MRPVVQIIVLDLVQVYVLAPALVTAKANAREDARETVRLIVPNNAVLGVVKLVKADVMQNVLPIACLDVKNNVLLHVEERVQWVAKVLVDVVVAVVAATHVVVVVAQTVVVHARERVVMVAPEVA